ncbi:MAG: DUF262 domain-containing protein [Chitinophagales bacterium]
MAFNPKQEYLIVEDKIRLKDFHDYKDYYITRPPYQRKAVWSVKKQQALIDSIFRRYYVPKLVIREVRLSEEKTINEIIDGQQRITSIQNFFNNKFKLPKSLGDIHKDLPGKLFKDLSPEFRMFIDKNLNISGDVIKNIEDPKNPAHQKTATEIFWRLQQGESLNFMEIAHAQLSSTARNFVVKYSDDITFDFENYIPIDSNKNKHNFFKIIDRKNDRMQHLALMTRFLILEEADNYVDVRDSSIFEFIDKYIEEDGIGNESFENTETAKSCIRNLNLLYDIFGNDTMLDKNNGIKELSREYVIMSVYFLVRHLKKYYVVDEKEKETIKEFFYHFYQRWSNQDGNDLDIMQFSNNRQQSANNIRERDIVFRQLFFDYVRENNLQLITKDGRRMFNESERIKIYRRDKGLCQKCLKEEKNEKEAQVSWSEYQADHIFPHAKGGLTDIENGQVLCRYHNAQKGARIETE